MLAYPLFDEVVHALGVGFDIFGREIVPSRIEAQGYGIVGFARGDGGMILALVMPAIRLRPVIVPSECRRN